MSATELVQKTQTSKPNRVQDAEPSTDKHMTNILPLKLRQLETPEQQSDFEPMTQNQPLLVHEQPVFDVIRKRRSVGQVTQEEPTREQIERMLEAATYAPSHHVTEPWRFIIITGTAREEFGNIMAASLSLRMEDRFSDKARAQLMRERNKPLRAPVIITMAMVNFKEMKGIPIENIESAGAAVQNMLLAAEEMELATLWRTGDTAYDPMVKRWLGMTPEDHIVGFIYVGFPKVTRPQRVPTHFSQRTTWLS